MALGETDYLQRSWIITLMEKFVQFKPFVQNARDSIATTSEEVIYLVRHIRTLQDFYMEYLDQNIPNAQVVAMFGSTKATELSDLRDALIALKDTLILELVGVQLEFNANDDLSYPPLDQSTQNTVSAALDSVLALYV